MLMRKSFVAAKEFCCCVGLGERRDTLLGRVPREQVPVAVIRQQVVSRLTNVLGVSYGISGSTCDKSHVQAMKPRPCPDYSMIYGGLGEHYH